MSKLALVSTFIILTLFTGCSSKQQSITEAGPAAAISVAAAQAVTRTVPAAFDETGTFDADESSDLAPLTGGRIAETPVDVGDFVKKGQVVCQLDSRDAQLRLDQAKAQLSQATFGWQQAQSRLGLSGESAFEASRVPEVAAARAAFESAQAQARLAAADARRYENLLTSGDVSRSAYERVKTQQETAEAQANASRQQFEAAQNNARQGYRGVEMAQAGLEAARAQFQQAQKALDDTSVRAPFDGYITARPVAVGQYVGVTNKVATIVRMGLLKLKLQTPEMRASQVQVGMRVSARVAAYPDREFTGKVTAVNPAVDPASRVFVVEAQFENAKSDLKPGMFATARVLLPGGETAVYVPQKAVLRDRTTDSYQVYSIESGKARLRVVVTGQVEGDQIRIMSGLSGGESVATSELGRLFDGATVQTKS